MIEILGEYFAKRAEITLVFIFGSAVKGLLTEDSDVDMAILFKEIPDHTTLNQIRNDLSDAFKREIDVVVLNDSSPIIRMQVLKNGILAVNKDSAVYNDLFVRTVKEYDDLKHIRKEIEDSILKGRIYA